ncbi:hypothetical protein [Ottowia beijingensis]|uniref:hypothetical protein n=1 Tax=Ottowia beijingensis TaxID=1207057 RepID=UPI00214DC934|nr:hypothetical protein [Ottowia beijingensis]
MLAVFPDVQLNRDLYLWLAAQGACHVATPAGWLADNVAATQRALQRFPGLRTRYARLVQAHLAQRAAPSRLQGSARAWSRRCRTRFVPPSRKVGAGWPAMTAPRPHQRCIAGKPAPTGIGRRAHHHRAGLAVAAGAACG